MAKSKKKGSKGKKRSKSQNSVKAQTPETRQDSKEVVLRPDKALKKIESYAKKAEYFAKRADAEAQKAEACVKKAAKYTYSGVEVVPERNKVGRFIVSFLLVIFSLWVAFAGFVTYLGYSLHKCVDSGQLTEYSIVDRYQMTATCVDRVGREPKTDEERACDCEFYTCIMKDNAENDAQISADWETDSPVAEVGEDFTYEMLKVMVKFPDRYKAFENSERCSFVYRNLSTEDESELDKELRDSIEIAMPDIKTYSQVVFYLCAMVALVSLVLDILFIILFFRR